MNITVIDGGTRKGGNTEVLTNYALMECEYNKIDLRDYDIRPVVDYRHSESGFPEVGDEYNDVIDQVLRSDIVVFATPIYWFGMSGLMKNFIDRWSQTMRDDRYPDFKHQMAQKKMYVIAVGGINPSIKGLSLIQQFQYIFDFIGAEFAGYVLGQANKPGEIEGDRKALLAAKQLISNLEVKG
ncbi:flavodoxin family protein [Alkalibacillus aidingensis]|uniref:flavodoxin family protein n=1 Tax=Alkalibacillus aidingensis TaxID=2747607 RepID=UPI001660694B|nr:flavodoxin family protein [Alkalibacillus aidingensis]